MLTEMEAMRRVMAVQVEHSVGSTVVAANQEVVWVGAVTNASKLAGRGSHSLEVGRSPSGQLTGGLVTAATASDH